MLELIFEINKQTKVELRNWRDSVEVKVIYIPGLKVIYIHSIKRSFLTISPVGYTNKYMIKQ